MRIFTNVGEIGDGEHSNVQFQGGDEPFWLSDFILLIHEWSGGKYAVGLRATTVGSAHGKIYKINPCEHVSLLRFGNGQRCFPTGKYLSWAELLRELDADSAFAKMMCSFGIRS